ncbi:copper resistance CopC/CopD family protein [Metarhizobium album]|nr:copper resistance CopC/CopD family protein [Rhizobium album]
MKNSVRGDHAFMALLAGIVWLCLTSIAMAHASLTSAEPADGAVVQVAPQRFSLSFSEPVSPLALKLVRPDGQTLALDTFVLRDRTLEIEPPEGLSPGTYVLSWRVVSEDGHPVAGSAVFSIGAPSGAAPAVTEADDWPVRVALWIGRVGLYAGLFFGIGGVFASFWLLRGSDRGGACFAVVIVVGLAGTILSAGLQGLDALGVPLSGLFDSIAWRAGLGTSFGRTVIVMTAALLLAALATLPRLKPWGHWLACVALLAGAGALALSGHASAAAPQWLTRPSVFLHAATIAIWIGALLPLAKAVRDGGTGAEEALRRFSLFIPYAVAVLVVAGLVLAVIQVEHPAALVETAYGNVLLVKAGLLLVLFALVAVNRWLLTKPALAGETTAVRRLLRAIVVETVLVLAIFAVAATWRFTPPPRALAIAAAQPASFHIHTDKAMADVTISPGRTGPVTVSAIVMTTDFGALDAKNVSFVFSNPAAGVEPIRRKAFKPGDGTWQVDGLVLPLPGTWTVRLDVLISDYELARLQGEIAIRP